MKTLFALALLTLTLSLAFPHRCEAMVQASEIMGDIDVSSGAGSTDMLRKWGYAALTAHFLERQEGLEIVLLFGNGIIAMMEGKMPPEPDIDRNFPTEADKTRLVFVLAQHCLNRAGALPDAADLEAGAERLVAFCEGNVSGYGERRDDMERAAALFLLMAGEELKGVTP